MPEDGTKRWFRRRVMNELEKRAASIGIDNNIYFKYIVLSRVEYGSLLWIPHQI